MTIRTLVPRTSLTIVLSEITYTQGRLKADSECAPYVGTFVALRQQWTTVHDEEVVLREAVAHAQALVDHQNGRFNLFVLKLTGVLDGLTGENRRHDLFKRFFGRKTPSLFRRSSLPTKHAVMVEWQKHLDKSDESALKDLSAELAALMADGAAALAARTAAEAARDQFKYAGERSAFIEAVNGARKETWGALAKRQHDNPRLPRDYADGFFRHVSAEEEKEEPTIESVTEELEALKKQVAEKQAQLDALNAAQAAAQALADKEKVLAALGKQKLELENQEASIRAEIEAGKKARKGKRAPKARK